MASEKTAARPKTRRSYSEEFKAQVLAECKAPGASVARVAMSHGINENVVHRWRQLARECRAVAASARRSEFVPVTLTATNTCPGNPDIRVEVRRGATAITVSGPCSAAVEPVDLRAGMDTVPARVVAVFGAAQPYQAYLFTNRRANRIKVLVHDGFGVWLVVRRLHRSCLLWAAAGAHRIALSREQFDALVLGLPWQRLDAAAVIKLV